MPRVNFDHKYTVTEAEIYVMEEYLSALVEKGRDRGVAYCLQIAEAVLVRVKQLRQEHDDDKQENQA